VILSASSAAATFLLLFLFCHSFDLLCVSSSAEAHICVRVEISHTADVEAASSILLHLGLRILLVLFVFNDLLCEVAENIIDTSSGLCTGAEVLASHAHGKPFSLV
jgi:hypothetical protein